MTITVPFSLVNAPRVPKENIEEVLKAFRQDGMHGAVAQIYHIGYVLKYAYEQAMNAPEGSELRASANPHDAMLGDKLMGWARNYQKKHPFNEFVE